METHNLNSDTIHQTLTKPIFLVGLMGCGKSAIGSRTAKLWELQFYDMDKVIEQEEGLTVTQIFEEKGEAYFRQKELELTERLIKLPPCIIATGGGAFMNENIRSLIQKNAISVWLKADYEVLLERVSRKKTRPLLEQGNKAEILRSLMEQRTPYYEQAHVTVMSDNRPHKAMIKQLKKNILQFTSGTKE